MYLCNKENGKWITGGAFGDSETSNGLVNNWGDTNCNSWVDASPSLCAGPNYKENCAKSVLLTSGEMQIVTRGLMLIRHVC